MKRIAFFGPLNPTRSGISDYDEELLPLLREVYEIDVFIDGKSAEKYVYAHQDFYMRNKRKPYDLTIYQMGNSMLHEYMYGHVFRNPGAIVFHDYCLHHSRAQMLLLRGFANEYREELAYAHPEMKDLAEIVIAGSSGDLLLYSYPFVRLLLQSALSAGTHTDLITDRLKASDTPVVKIPMYVRNDPVESVEDPAPGKIVIASFGLATREKRISSVLAALVVLRAYHPDILYVIAGESSKNYDIRYHIERFGLQDNVRVTGFLERNQFQEWMNRADIVVNLRYPSAGEMSATLLRAMACGKPVLISRLQQTEEIPVDAVLRIRPDQEQSELCSNILALIENKNLRNRYGKAASDYIHTHHKPEQTIAAYQELIDLGLRRKTNFRPPQLPLHLGSARRLVREYIKKSCFSNYEADLIDWVL